MEKDIALRALEQVHKVSHRKALAPYLLGVDGMLCS